MTVCVAAICAPAAVIGMSDRMLTAGDVQFTPQRSKIVAVTTSIVAMISGDIALAHELLVEVTATVNARIQTEPQNWWKVKDVAELWKAAYLERLKRESESKWMAPLGLTLDTFISRNRELNSGLAGRLTQELLNYDLPIMEVIFAGIDQSGPHLYVADGGKVWCQDAVGFAAVGSGASHAKSQLMFSGHTASSPFNKTLYHIYAAKKRAEVAPGVGQETDSFIAWQLGGSSVIRDDIIDLVKTAYEEVEQQSKQITVETEEKVHAAIQGILDGPTTHTQAAPEITDGNTSSLGIDDRDGADAKE